ncbi:MAG: hypothetical protein COA47_10140 [Robiginitomaculum sp.]|nr:MAG: hypothetical protein COA47_10140 [Robiginitomaculum sp.]
MVNVTINIQLPEGATLHEDLMIGKKAYGNGTITGMASYDLFGVVEVAEEALNSIAEDNSSLAIDALVSMQEIEMSR